MTIHMFAIHNGFTNLIIASLHVWLQIPQAHFSLTAMNMTGTENSQL